MYVYSLGQWLLFFFLYCFLGWVWESCYVSAKRRQWVNRGFLHGPMLPIYGTGAVIILLATIPVRDSLWLVFLLGMLAATALEYVTGAAMEALFKVRYWDYSKQPFNLNGYICLTSSLAWGAFSILLVRFLHPPVEDLVLRLPAFLVDPLAFLLTIAVTVDAVRSFQAAMDLREVLTRLTEENEDLRRLAKRVEVISAFAEEDLRRFRERTEVERLLRQERWEDTRRQIQEAYAKGARRRQAQLEESLRRRTDAKLTAHANIHEALEADQSRLAVASDLTESLWRPAGRKSSSFWTDSGTGKLPSAPAPPGVIASPCASCGATPPPAPKPLPRPWSPCGSWGIAGRGRTANEESRRSSPCSAERSLVPYGADVPSFRVPL